MDPEESTPEDLDAYFVSFREVKTGPCHRYYLIRGDSRGGQTLGAVGVPSSSGAASGAQPAYDYRNARNFTNHGTLATSSKRELMTWLDGVVAEGIARQAVETGGGAPAETGRANDDDGGAVGGQPGGGSGANPSSPRGSEWINFSQDKFSFPDGRRGIRFYLVDAQGGATAAVLGEERDTRDGHYVYRKDDDFTAGPPLNCGNLTGVHRWLRDMCAGGAGVLLGTAGAHVPKRGGAKGGGAGSKLTGGNRNDREHPLDVLGKRRAPSEHHRSSHTGDEDTIATRRLRVEEREVRWLTARRAALAFVREEIHPHTQSEITKVAKALAEHVADSEEAHPGGTNKSKGKKAKERAENALARVVEALRSLSSQYVSLKVMDGTNIVRSVASLRTHPHPTVAKMAEGLCTQWLGSVHNAVGTLAASYERPPPPPPPTLNPNAGASGAKKPKPVYDEAFLAAMRNEPQLRRTRQKTVDKTAAASNPGVGGGSGGPGGVGSGGASGSGGDAKPPPAAAPKAEPNSSKAAGAKAATAKSQHKSPPKHAAKVSPPAAAAASAAAGGKKKGGSPVFAPHNPGTPLGKGRKLCLECNGVVGSPTRVCPHCNATLPFKQHTANSPKGAAAKNAAAAAKRRASAEGDGGGSVGGGAGAGGGGGGVGASASVAQFLGRHRERFVSCKVSQLRRNVQEVCEGVRAVLDAGRVQDPGAAKHLREMSKKVGEVRLFQGVVERPRARKEVMGLIEAAVKVCNRHGV